MGLRFSRDERDGVFVVEADPGTPMAPELLDAVDAEIVQAAGTTAGLHILYDMRPVDTGALTMGDMEDIARQDNARWASARGTRMAICVGGKLMLGQVRQYQIISEPGRPYAVGVFEDVAAARRWLLDASLPDS